MSIYGLRYASGPYLVLHSIPASAFSQGDLVYLDSNGSLAAFAESAFTIAGVALSASTASYKNLVPYVAADPLTVFWSETTTAASQFTVGEMHDFEIIGGRHILNSSQTTKHAIVIQGTKEVDQSTNSGVLVRIMKGALATGAI